ncbi:MAG: hypothetical protein QOE14_2317, partial [Humisphaera sp.]|nr:hypothetical protein [Humisphaera sp.]
DPKILDALDEHLKLPLSQLASERR